MQINNSFIIEHPEARRCFGKLQMGLLLAGSLNWSNALLGQNDLSLYRLLAHQ